MGFLYNLEWAERRNGQTVGAHVLHYLEDRLRGETRILGACFEGLGARITEIKCRTYGVQVDCR
jgi:hypothetical protein